MVSGHTGPAIAVTVGFAKWRGLTGKDMKFLTGVVSFQGNSLAD